MTQEHGMSVRRSCAALNQWRSVYSYKPAPRDYTPVIELLLQLAERYPRYGFAKLFRLIRRQGRRWNHKRVYRVYCMLNELTAQREEKASITESRTSCRTCRCKQMLVDRLHARCADEQATIQDIQCP